MGTIVLKWPSCIHKYHKLKKEMEDGSANIPLLPFIKLFQTYIKTSDFPDLYADGSLS